MLKQDEAAKLLKEMAAGAAGRTLRVLPKQLAVDLLCHMGNPAAWVVLKALTEKAAEELLSRVTLYEGLRLTHVRQYLGLPSPLCSYPVGTAVSPYSPAIWPYSPRHVLTVYMNK